MGSCSSIVHPLFSCNKYVKLWRVVVDYSSPMTRKGSVRTEEAETQAHNYAKYHGGWETPPTFHRPCLERGRCRELGSIEEECGPPPAGRVQGIFWNSKQRLMRGTRCFCILMNSADDTWDGGGSQKRHSRTLWPPFKRCVLCVPDPPDCGTAIGLPVFSSFGHNPDIWTTFGKVSHSP